MRQKVTAKINLEFTQMKIHIKTLKIKIKAIGTLVSVAFIVIIFYI